ncbi:hypothetical protein C0V97_03965 [Asaia sp. W19]|uniref:hypothetical protein n=1 Tax=unclassified Asaia TaxID=2685023 RepID=UPI000F8E496E|nr:hypothetical protein [Asaia sp. W19]RUT26844.1 hypothetical protein C0V97_03965 [Asaia sp. W19]
MIEWMDRGLQRELLLKMAEEFPLPVDLRLSNGSKAEIIKAGRNLIYLQGHGLCQAASGQSANTASAANATTPEPIFKITAKGLDFLQDDGGLSAILNVVTVRFEADTLRALIAAKIDASSEPEEKKAKAKSLLSAVKEEGLKQLTSKVVGEGLSSLPHIADWVISAI